MPARLYRDLKNIPVYAIGDGDKENKTIPGTLECVVVGAAAFGCILVALVLANV